MIVGIVTLQRAHYQYERNHDNRTPATRARGRGKFVNEMDACIYVRLVLQSEDVMIPSHRHFTNQFALEMQKAAGGGAFVGAQRATLGGHATMSILNPIPLHVNIPVLTYRKNSAARSLFAADWFAVNIITCRQGKRTAGGVA